MAVASLLHNVSALLVTCTRHVSRAARCLTSKVAIFSKTNRREKLHKTLIGKGKTVVEPVEGAIWRHTILLGEKCRPLDFSGAIHYDSDGRRTPTPRTPVRNSPLRIFSSSENNHVYENYTVKSAYNFLIKGVHTRLQLRNIWHLKAPLQIRVFGWLCLRNSIHTIDDLLKRGMILPNMCCLCYANAESIHTYFLNAPLQKRYG
ncbi:hypothetical protein LUZ60_000705 [Juncus effusus]|nr:hypothetical protein LUZ60_000705 [Juncus effusus]